MGFWYNERMKKSVALFAAMAAWGTAAGAVLDAVKASCRRQLGCCDESICDVVRFSEALVGESDAAKSSGDEWRMANDERAARLVATQREEGSWPDVDYVHMTRSMFNAVRHLDNMRAIARSPRTPEKERANNDNLLGAHTADGALFTYVTGDEYRDVFPLWNWRHIPGITSYDEKNVDWKSRNRSEVCVRDGDSVRFVLDCAGLKATTVWRFSEAGVDVSVTEISSEKDKPVATTVEQSIAQPGAKWWREKDGIVAVNGAIRYELPSNAVVCVVERSGSWKDSMEELSDEKVSGRVFEIVIPHGRRPSGASCSWRVRPNGIGHKEQKKIRAGRDVRVPNRMPLIHSHNDYAQERPFWGAYEAGADSIEADVYLVGGDLLVAHTRKELKKENTLRRLYLEPLREVMRKNGGRARADGKPLQLMVDIKSGKAALGRLLEIVEQEGFRDCFDIVKNPSATRLTVTGDHSKAADFLAYPDFVFFDVPPTRQLADGQYKRVPLVSQCASAYTRWRSGAMNEADKEKIRNAVRQAHAKGAKFRLWAYPDNPGAWRLAMELGLDYINTDRPADVAAFLRNLEKKPIRPF